MLLSRPPTCGTDGLMLNTLLSLIHTQLFTNIPFAEILQNNLEDDRLLVHFKKRNVKKSNEGEINTASFWIFLKVSFEESYVGQHKRTFTKVKH